MAEDTGDRTGRRLLIGGGVAIALCALAGLTFIIYLAGASSPTQARVERAVRASFPTFCSRPGEHLVIEQSKQLPWQFDRWVVLCEPGPLPWRLGAMEVHLFDCTVHVPTIYNTLDWGLVYGGLFVAGQKMSVCP